MGATVLLSNRMDEGSAVSMGGYLVLNPEDGGIDYNNATLLHEYGHFLQTRQWGGIATLGTSIDSGLSAGLKWRSIGKHKDIWIEKDANARALSYFGNRLDDTQRERFSRKYPGQYFDDNLSKRCFFPFLFPFWFYESITFSDR